MIGTVATLPPAVDVFEDAFGVTLYADLPGVPKDKLTLQVDENTLTIEGEVMLCLPEGMKITHTEMHSPRYRRVFTLSRELDCGKVDAEFNHGVLRLRIPRAEHVPPPRVEIKVV
ncbi:MAG: Hsp20/alpha crystallin family protein [Pseudomonadota bacterium]|nr:Hsp20/alpha crystallin family protein [Pseudomonadota bacterium]